MDIMLIGLSKCGKTSIKKVVFEKMSPHESIFLESNTSIESFKVESLGYSSLIVRDFPYNFNSEKLSPTETKYIESSGVLIFVIDSQDTTDETYDYFRDTIIGVLKKNPKISIEVFLHKADGAYFLQSNNMNKHRTEVQSKVKEILNDLNLDINIGIYSTSIYDHSLYEAFSKIFQKLFPQNSLLSSLLDNLSNSCRFEKAYLFDVYNKIYLAVDFSPIEEQFYEICSDMIDVVLDMSGIYGENTKINDEFFDENSSSLIKINNTNKSDNSKSYLYLRFIDVNLALIAIVNDENYERQHLIDYNLKLFSEAVKEIFKI